MKDSFSKYSAYAIGEILLVVVGILIALQIDNWNEDRKERATLQSYLESIARNMREDLSELEPLRQQRLNARHTAASFDTLRNRDRFDVEEIFYVNQVITLSTSEAFFSANTSGFDALKNSGVLDRLQASGLEHLLYAYYDTVNQVGFLEHSMYDAIRPIRIELERDRPRDMPGFAIINPSGLPTDLFEELQPMFSQLVNHPMMNALVGSQMGHHLLMLHYDQLRVLGNEFIRAVEADPPGQVETLPQTPLGNWKQNLGLPLIVTDGQPALESYWMSGITPPGTQAFRFDSISIGDGQLHVDYPGGEEWAAVEFLSISSNLAAERNHMDFTRFTKLRLELKGDSGGEVINVHVKDADYPDYLAPISKSVTLTDDWQSYEFDLAEFAPTDFGRLHVVLGFVIHPATDPLAFSIRNASYH